MEKYELRTIYSTQKSFYGKAFVEILSNGSKMLYSYNTLVCTLRPDNKISHIGYYSQTTTKHINEFLMQNGHNGMSKKEIEKLAEQLPSLSL